MLKIALISPPNINDLTSIDTAKYTLNYTYPILQTATTLSLFRSNTSTRSHKGSEKIIQGKSLWWDAYCQIRIKDFLPAQASLCEYMWEVVACMLITVEGQVGLDIRLETPNQGIGTENIIIMTWSKQALR